MPPLEEDNLLTRLAILETQMKQVIKQNDHIIEKLEKICPAVDEHTWWIERIKWGFVTIAVVGVALGIVAWAWR